MAKELAYTELQVASNFSFLRGASHPEELVREAAVLGYKAIALTDLHSLAGIVRAHHAAKECGIGLITGAAVRLYEAGFAALVKQQDEPVEALPHHLPDYLLPCSLLLYPTSRHGYKNLCSLLTLGKLRTLKGQCVLSLDDLRDHEQGLLAIAVVHSFHHRDLLTHLQKLLSIFDSDRLSLAVFNQYGPNNAKHMARIEQLSRLAGIPMAATNDVHYHCPERRQLQDVLTCIRKHTTLQEAGLLLFQNAERYLKSPQEMLRLFRYLPQAVQRSQEIAQAALQFSLDELRYEYPEEICPRDKTPLQYLTDLTWLSAKERYPEGIPEKIRAQIEYELNLIRELNYAKYFLTVYDIVVFASSRKILCQGRGAAANSAVCYVLGITAVSPDCINMLFERFISKERNEPPDIDIDFEHERREEVIQYIYKKYGRHRAALTATVISYRSRSAVRDIGKVFGLPPETIENILRLITRSDSPVFSNADLRERSLDPSDQAVLQTIAFTEILRGFPRHLSQHPGGFIISQDALSSIVPIENAAMPERTVIEWDKDDIDRMGMLKIDVLGLGMLSCIRKALELLNDPASPIPNRPRQRLELYSIPPEDPKVYQMLCNADAIGVFQVESRAQMSMLPRLRPKCFYDLVIEVAIVRPGPIVGGMVHPYLRRRNGLEAVSYPDEKIEKILKPTLGVPIFQEQVMELAITGAGFTPGEADRLRRAIASWKKHKDGLNKFREKIISGMLQNGYNIEFAERVFKQIQGFGEYGFPQSHSASFALLVYVSAWIKCHHPAVFAAALLNSQPMGFYQPAQIINDAKQHGVEVRPVDVNHSAWDCTLEHGAPENGTPENGTLGNEHPALRLGMRLVSGFRQVEAEKITAVVNRHGTCASPQELWRLSGVRTAALKTLARADAFRSMQLNRQQALWHIAKLRDAALPLFDGLPFDRTQEEVETGRLPEFSGKQQVVRDFKSLGFSLKAHPLSFLRPQLSAQGVSRCSEIKQEDLFPHGCRTAAAGMVLIRQRPQTASGIVFMTIEDETGMNNVIIKPKMFAAYRDVLCDSVFVLVYGRIQREGQVIHLLLEEAKDLTQLFDGLEHFPFLCSR